MPEVPSDEALATIKDPNRRLVDAGARLLVDDGFRVLANGLSPDLVTGRAGRTRRVFYDRFDTKEEFLRRLLGVYLEFDLDDALGPHFEDAFRELFYEARGDIYEAVGDITSALFPEAAASTEPLIHTIAWSVGATDPQVRALVERYYEDVDVMYDGIITQALASWNQRLRPPWTVRMLTTTLRCLADGAYARNVIHPGTVTAEVFALQVVALITPMIQPDDEPDREFGQELRAASRRNIARWRRLNAVEKRANTRGFVLDSLVPALRQSETGSITIEQLALWADVSERSIRDAFGTVDEVIGAAVLESLPALAREAGFDIRTEGFTGHDMLGRHILRLARWVDTNPELAHGTLVMLVQRPSGGPSNAAQRVLAQIRRPFVEIFEQTGGRAGPTSASEVVGLADMLTHAVLHRSVSSRRSPEAMAGFLVDLALGPAPKLEPKEA